MEIMVTTSEGRSAPAAPAPGSHPAGTDQPDPATSPFEPVSGRGPALVVLAIAVGIVLVGIFASALVSGNAPVFTVQKVTLPDGGTVSLSPATAALHGIVGAGEPPADILGNLGVPAGSRVTGTLDSDQHASQFDRTVSLSSVLGASQVVAVYRTLLPRLGWQLLYVGAAPQKGAGTEEVLAKHPSGDGYYWEAGVVVSPTTTAGITPFSIELFQIPDDNG